MDGYLVFGDLQYIVFCENERAVRVMCVCVCVCVCVCACVSLWRDALFRFLVWVCYLPGSTHVLAYTHVSIMFFY